MYKCLYNLYVEASKQTYFFTHFLILNSYEYIQNTSKSFSKNQDWKRVSKHLFIMTLVVENIIKLSKLMEGSMEDWKKGTKTPARASMY